MENSKKYKYILYLTVNSVNQKIYIGVHRTETPYEFDGYLGCGIWSDSPSSYLKKETPLQKAVSKYGPDNFKRITLAVFDTDEEALSLEASFVNAHFINRPDTYNAVIGGGAPPLLSRSVNQFDLQGNFIQSWESGEDVRRHFNCKVQINSIIKNKRNFAGYYWSRENTIDISEYKRLSKRNFVDQYDCTGNHVASFKNFTTVCEKLNIPASKLRYAMHKKIPYNGYYFLRSGINIQEVFKANADESKKITANRHPVYRYRESGEFDKSFCTTKEAADETPCAYSSSIKNAVTNGYLCGGYRWSYSKATNYFDLTDPHKYIESLPVAQYTIEGELIKVWDDYKECKKEFPYCLDVCKGKSASTKGYVFKYLAKDIV